MILLILTATIMNIWHPVQLLEFTSSLSVKLQTSCLQSLPLHTPQTPALAALICGQSLLSSDLKQILLRLSLIHLFVVSGSHLIWIEQVLSILRVPLFWRTAFLGFYTLLTGWQAPAVRALIQILLRLFLKPQKIYLPADLRVLIAGLSTLLLFPAWWNSLSLLMSWSASLALSWNPFPHQKKSWQKTLSTQFFIWLLMLGPLWGLGSLHPLSCLYNLIFGPLVGFILLPLALLAASFPPMFLPLFAMTLDFLTALGPSFTEPIIPSSLPPLKASTLWMWLAVWHLVFHAARVYFSRKQERLI